MAGTPFVERLRLDGLAGPHSEPGRSLPVEGQVVTSRPLATVLPNVSVIVPVFEHTEHLSRCLGALAGQDYPGEYEILVVDNGAEEPVTPVVVRLPRARLVREEQAGSYAARNRGVREAQAEILAFTDADCTPERRWLSSGVQALLAEPRCGLIAGRIDVEVGDQERPTAAELYDSVVGFRQQEYVERWHFGATANLFTRREVFDRVGPFDVRLRSLGDREWGHRVRQAGFSIRYAEAACTRHPARQSVGQLLRRARRMAGGYFEIARTRQLPARVLLRDIPMGLATHGVLAARTDCSHEKAARRWPRSTRERMQVVLVTGAVVATRTLELMRLILGGEPRRC
jgi:GT2 family glycosyltransferase